MNLAKSASLEWFSDLIDLVIKAQNNEFLVKRIERDARALLDKRAERPEMCWLILAFTAFLQGDRGECVRCADAAYALATRDLMIVGNVASLLGNAGEPRLAAMYAGRFAALSNGDPRIAINAARALCTTLHLEDAAEIMRAQSVQRVLREDDSILEDDAILRHIDEIAASFQSYGVDSELRVALLELAISTIRSEGCAIRQVTPMYYPDDNTMRYEIYSQASPAQCGHLNIAIAEALIKTFDEAYPELITFTCRPLSSYKPADTFVEVIR